MKASAKHFLPFSGVAGTVLAVVVWTVLILASLLTQKEQLNRAAAELARIDAIANLKKDMAIRKWASSVGGIFVREKNIPPINSLEQEERYTAVRGTGERIGIVSVTPMHLLLAIQGMTNKEFGSQERLTSKQLRNLDNAPDEWERQALESLDKGANIVTESLPKKGGHGLMRAMIPMRMEKECLDCHRDTLIPVGGLRGGATVSIDLNTYRTAQEPTWRAIRSWHAGVWLLGIATIFLLHRVSRKRAADLLQQDEVRRENEAAFAAMAEGAVITDAQGTILWVNDAFCGISGYAREEVIGRNPRILKSGVHDRSFYTRLWESLYRDGHWRGEIWNKRKSGEIFPEEISMQALRGPDGRIRRYISIFSDITQRKKNESDLAAHREHLEDLVKQRTEELTVARDQAEAANHSKSTFLANMSHELCTPLNAVIGFSQLMEKDHALSSQNQRNLQIINHSGRHLLTLINDILELSKIESGKMEMRPEEVDVKELLEQVVDMMRLRADEKGLALKLVAESLPAIVCLDPGMLRQIMLNLLSNAVKFTAHGEIVVRALARPVRGDTVELSFAVRDTGIGISAEDRERIFSSFEQIGSLQQGGTGLGLTISRHYAHLMGGELAVESKPGEGACFSFAIEVLTKDGVAVKADESESAGLTNVACPAHSICLERKMSALVVDDSPEGRLLVGEMLRPLGFDVDEAENLAAARNALETSAPDLVLLDWYLPDGEGIDLVPPIKRRGAEGPAVIMLSANAMAESRAASLAAGVDGFLSKPFAESDLLRMIENVFESRGAPISPQAMERVDADFARNALPLLPQEVRERLIRAVISLNPIEIEAMIADVEAVLPTLGEKIAALSRQRRYQELWDMLGIEGSEA